MLDKLSHREKLMVSLAVVAVAITIGWAGIWAPIVEKRAMLGVKIKTKKKELAKVTALAGKILYEKERLGHVENRMASAGNSSPLAVMENIAVNSGVKTNVASMTPQPPASIGDGYRESAIELKLEKTSLGRLVTFLKAIRDYKSYMRVKRISIKSRYDNPGQLDVSISVAGYRRRKE